MIKKFDKETFLKKYKKAIIKIENSENKQAKSIATKYNNLAKKMLTDIEKTKLAKSTINRLIPKLKLEFKADKEIGKYVHHTFNSQLESIKNKYKITKKELELLQKSDMTNLPTNKELAIKSVKKRIKLSRNEKSINELNKLINEISALKNDIHLFRMFKQDNSIKNHVRTLAKNKIDEYSVLKNKKNISINEINLLIKKLILSNNMYDTIFLLSLVSGRRFIEIVNTNVCNFSKSNKKNIINVSSNAKSSKTKIATIPLLMPANIFLKKLKIVRESEYIKNLLNETNKYHSDKQNKIINDKMHAKCNKVAKQHFKDDNLVFKSTRSIYALVCNELFNHELEREHYIKKILMHDNLENQFFYKQFNIVNDDEVANISKRELTKFEKKLNDLNKNDDCQRVIKLQEFLNHDDILKSQASKDLLNFIIELVKNDNSIILKNADFTSTIKKYKKSYGKNAINTVMKLIKDFKKP